MKEHFSEFSRQNFSGNTTKNQNLHECDSDEESTESLDNLLRLFGNINISEGAL